MFKTWPLPRTVCVCVSVWGGGGGQDVKTIQISTMTRLYRPPAVLAGGAGDTNAFYSHNARVGICVR